MPKVKNKKSISRRFKITKTGKILRRRQNARHLRSKKSKSHIRRMKKTAYLSKAFSKKIRKLLPKK